MYVTALLVPLAVVTVTGTMPKPAGATAVIWVSDTTVNEVAGTRPNRTAVAPVNPLPVRVTVVPPVTGPELGLIETSVGTERYVNGSPALVPAGVVTVTCTVPVPAGRPR